MNSNDSRTYNKCILSMIKNPLIYCVRLHEVDKSWSHAYVLHSLTCNFALHSSLITIITCIRLVEQNLSVHVDQIITELALLLARLQIHIWLTWWYAIAQEQERFLHLCGCNIYFIYYVISAPQVQNHIYMHWAWGPKGGACNWYCTSGGVITNLFHCIVKC